ncbi:MAG: hypothetical protein KKF48_02830 [Nanoarchaeota archaeon]|nr:hypothetical protein [Nanoarchaeota archaeon]MBU1027957.1 hypothetical protein [Nanoarchaeota archaeon]
MFEKKEIVPILITTLILGVVISLIESLELFLYSLLAVFLVIIVNIVAKKISCFYLDSEIEIKLWEFKRYGFKKSSYFKKSFPAGAFFPIIFTAFTLGYVNWMACLVFDVKAKIYRAAKRHQLYSFSEMTEWHIGLIAASGILANLIFAVLGYLMGFPLFTKINIYYVFFNMIPLSNLDGNKVFFGNFVMWAFLAALTLIGLGYIFLTI